MGTELMSILLTGLFILFVFVLLAALVYSLVRLMKAARTRDDTTGEQEQQGFLKASILNAINSPWR